MSLQDMSDSSQTHDIEEHDSIGFEKESSIDKFNHTRVKNSLYSIDDDNNNDNSN